MLTLRAIGHAMVRALRAMVRTPRTTVWVIGTIALAFVLLGVVQLSAHNVDAATERLGGAHMSVYLDDGISAQRVAVIASALAALPEVAEHTYVSRAAALERLRATLGEDDLVAGIEVGLVPASIEVVLAPEVRDAAALAPVVTRLEATPGVESVEVSAAWIDRLSAVQGDLSRLGWVMFLLVGGACVYFVTTAIGLRARSTHRDTEVFELVGASAFFTRGPVIIEGLVLGLLGAALATVLLWSLHQSVAEVISQLTANVFDRRIEIGFLPTAQVALLIVAGGFLGLLGGALASLEPYRRHPLHRATGRSRYQATHQVDPHALA